MCDGGPVVAKEGCRGRADAKRVEECQAQQTAEDERQHDKLRGACAVRNHRFLWRVRLRRKKRCRHDAGWAAKAAECTQNRKIARVPVAREGKRGGRI